ncbi:hypothetical protein [Mycobacteroides abscessus]|uniref:hypothetical protein n=1 Tax=Mycobacteroides abscessus TaxID=36809 RepID=UPI000C266433|nr:hypothetical protein [Mycobacteroides abscessus]
MIGQGLATVWRYRYAGIASTIGGGSRAMPTDTQSAVSISNFFISWLNVADANGAPLASYHLSLNASTWKVMHQVYEGLVSLIYQVFLIPSTYTASIHQWVADPHQWVDPLSQAYNSATSKLYQVIPPMAIVGITLAVLIARVFMSRGEGSKAKISREQWDRLATAFVLAGFVALLAYNPFQLLIAGPMDFLSTVVSWFSFSNNEGGIAQSIASSSTEIVRQVTWLINYQTILPPECGKAWSEALAAGQDPGMLECVKPYASKRDPDELTVLAAIGSLFVMYGRGYFTVVMVWKFFNHITLFIGWLIALAWICAVALMQRRPFDPLANALARAGSNFLMALSIFFLAAFVPILLVEVVTAFTVLPAFLQIGLIAGGEYIAGKAILAYTKDKESLYKLFKSRVEKSDHWKNLYPDKDKGVLETMTAGSLSGPWSQVTDLYQRSQQGTVKAFKEAPANVVAYIESLARSAVAQKDEGMPDNNRAALAVEKATELVDMRDKTTVGKTVTVPAPAKIPLEAGVSAEGGGEGSTVAVPTSEWTKNGLETVYKAGTLATWSGKGMPSVNDPAGDQTAVKFRGGIPFEVIPQPQSPASSTESQGPDTAPIDMPSMRPTDPLAAHRQSITEHLAALRGDDVDPVREATTTIARHATDPAAPAAAAPRRSSSSAAELMAPTLVENAGFMRSIKHLSNLLRAHGNEATLVVSAEDAGELIMFTSNAQGENTIQSRHGLGFGDTI